jgi:hypothetical protein
MAITSVSISPLLDVLAKENGVLPGPAAWVDLYNKVNTSNKPVSFEREGLKIALSRDASSTVGKPAYTLSLQDGPFAANKTAIKVGAAGMAEPTQSVGIETVGKMHSMATRADGILTREAAERAAIAAAAAKEAAMEKQAAQRKETLNQTLHDMRESTGIEAPADGNNLSALAKESCRRGKPFEAEAVGANGEKLHLSFASETATGGQLKVRNGTTETYVQIVKPQVISVEAFAAHEAGSAEKAALKAGGAALADVGVLARGAEVVAKKAGVLGLVVAGVVAGSLAAADGASAHEVAMETLDGSLPGAKAALKGDYTNALADASSIVGLDAPMRIALNEAGFKVDLKGNEDSTKFGQRLATEYSGPELSRHLQSGNGDLAHDRLSAALAKEYAAKINAIKADNDGVLPAGLPPSLRNQQGYIETRMGETIRNLSQLPEGRPIGVERIEPETASSRADQQLVGYKAQRSNMQALRPAPQEDTKTPSAPAATADKGQAQTASAPADKSPLPQKPVRMAMAIGGP